MSHNENNKHNAKEIPTKIPDAIIFPDEEQSQQRSYSQTNQNLKFLQQQRPPFWVHFLCILSTIFCFFWFLISLASSAIFSIFAFINRDYEQLKKLWGSTKRAGVFFLGSLIGIFSPTFGLLIVITYFTYVGLSFDGSKIQRIFGYHE